MRSSFRGKLFLAFAGLVAIALGAALVLVRAETERRVRGDFGVRFERTLAAFRQLQALRLRTVSDAVNALAMGNPQFRTVLSAASVGEDELGFGSAPSREEALRDANLRLRSLLPSLASTERHDVFAVANAAGELIYTRAAPERFGDSLRSVPPLPQLAAGEEPLALWDDASQLPAGVPLAPEPPPRAIYEVVAEPVSFGEELHGLVLVGTRIEREALDALHEISGLHVALVGPEAPLVTTLPGDAAAALAAHLASGAESPRAAGAITAEEWRFADQRWLAAPVEIAPGASRTRFVLLASLDSELAFLRPLETSFAVLGASTLLASLAFAFLLARGVARPVKTLARAAERVGAGDLDTQVAIASGDELEDLGDAFNRMVGGLRERDRIRRTFERHVSKEVAAELLRHPEALAPRGERREVTLLFSDLAGFTSLAERQRPEDVLAQLNEYYAALCDAVLASGGTVNELLGDGVLASFGAPIAQPDHALRACRAAALAEFHLTGVARAWRASGRPELRWRIGVHTGSVVVGEMGTEERTKYGVIGDAVNVASRLEGVNKVFGTTTLVSEATRAEVGDALVFREIETIRVLGRETPLRVFEPLGAPGEVSADRLAARDAYERALAAFRSRDFAVALAALDGLHAGDLAAASLRERARRFAASPPPPEWDGVFDVESK